MAWSPSQNTQDGYSPVLWLDANTIALTHLTGVGAWYDSSSSGNHAIQSTANFQPIFYVNQLHGYPAVRFDYTPYQQWIGGAVAGMNTAQVSAFAVVYHMPVTSFITNMFYMGLGDGAATVRRSIFEVNTNQTIRSNQKYAANTVAYFGPVQSLWNNWHLYSCTWDTNGGTNYPAFWIDKSPTTPIDRTVAGSGAVSLDSDRYALGRTGVLANSRAYMYVTELLYYPIVLSTFDRQQVEHYLDDKYAICPTRVQSAVGGHLGAVALPKPAKAGILGKRGS